MQDGDAALTITPVINGAGESEIVATTASLVDDIQREIDVSRLSPFEYDFASNRIIINFDSHCLRLLKYRTSESR